MKKILSLVLAFMMVLSMTSMAFATTFEDVSADNKALTSATELLNSLKIITGYEDGTFKPEQVVTRAEMATMLIKAKGFATIANDTPSFTDSQTHWAKGYIALASDLGIINGRGNGIFDPDATVTYEEAAIMMLRTLGFTNESINNGKSEAFNAANYRTKALSLNLFKDFTLPAMSAGAVRGNIALMLTRNLSNALVYTDNNGRAVIEKDDVIDADGKVVEVAKTLLSLVANKESKFNVTAKAVGEALVDISSYLYQNVVAYVVDGKVVYVERSNSKVVENWISAIDGNEIELGEEDVYTVDSKNALVYYNGVEVVAAKGSTAYKDAVAAGALIGSDVTLVLDKDEDGKYTIVKAIVAEKETKGVQVTVAYKTGSAVFNGIVLPIKSSKVDLTQVTVTGDATDINDIEVDDVVKAFSSINNTKVKLLVVRDAIDGKITRANNAGSKVFIDTVGDYVNSWVELKVAQEGRFFFDQYGYVFAFRPTNAVASTTYSMVSSAIDGKMINPGEILFKNPTLTIMNSAGETKKYTVAEKAEYTYGNKDKDDKLITFPIYDKDAKLNAAVKEGSISLSVRTNRAGELDLITIKATTPATNDVTVKSKTFLTASNVVIFNSNVGNETQCVNTLEELVALEKVAKNNFFYILNDRGEYAVIVIKGIDIVEPNTAYAIIKGQQRVVNDDGKIVDELVVYIDGEEYTYKTVPGLKVVDLDGQKIDFSAGKNLVELAIIDGLVVGAERRVIDTKLESTITTGSAITSVLSNRFQAEVKVDGKDELQWFFVYDAPIYVVNEKGAFQRVGSMDDLLLEGNVDFNVYHNENNVVIAIIVQIK